MARSARSRFCYRYLPGIPKKTNEFPHIPNQPVGERKVKSEEVSVGEGFPLPKTNTHRTQKGETKYLSFSVLFLLQHFFAPSAFAARGAFEVARKACVSRIHRFLIGRYNFGAAFFAFVSANADFELQCVKTRN